MTNNSNPNTNREQKEIKSFDKIGLDVHDVDFDDNGYETLHMENGDVLRIGPSHRARATKLFEEILPSVKAGQKITISVGGPSGSGKSEIGALISRMFNKIGHSSLLVPCDNYPKLVPADNDQNRKNIFNEKGRDALSKYLGSEEEILFSRLEQIIKDFKSGENKVNLRRIDMTSGTITDIVPEDITDISVLVFEGTWSCKIPGVDFPVFLDTDYLKSKKHREARNRVEIQDCENKKFIDEHVLPLEQAHLNQIKLTKAIFWLRYENDEAILEKNVEVSSGNGSA